MEAYTHIRYQNGEQGAFEGHVPLKLAESGLVSIELAGYKKVTGVNYLAIQERSQGRPDAEAYDDDLGDTFVHYVSGGI